MRFNVLRAVAATLSMGVCTVASAQYGPANYGGNPYAGPTSQLGIPQTQAVQTFGGGQYQTQNAPSYQPPANDYRAPAKWNNFGAPNPGPQLFHPASTGGYDSLLPTPESIPTPAPSFNNMAPAAQHAPPVQQHAAPQQHVQQHAAPQQHMQHSAPVEHYAAPAQHGATTHYGAPAADCESCNTGSAFMQAASQPWEGTQFAAQSCGMPVAAPVRAPLFPWFGSFDLLFFNLDTNGKSRNLVSQYSAVDPARPYLPAFGSGSVDPDSALGYQLSFGRYLGCGQLGLGMSYFNFDPGQEVFESQVFTPLTAAGGGGAIRANGMPQYNAATMDYVYDNGGGVYNTLTGAGAPYSVYDIVDGRAGQASLGGGDTNAAPGGVGTDSMAEAVRFRARRDIDIQGLEVNLFCFGLMGAQRASAASCGGGGCGTGGLGAGFRSFLGLGGGYGGVGGYGGQQFGGHGSCNTGCAPQGPRFGFGGAAGPLVRPCNGKVQVVTSHGLRWFQFRDSLDFAFDIEGRAGYTDHDLYDVTTTENDLIGYQFGSRLIYCLGSRVNLNLGGKFGIYGNQAEFTHRLGSQINAAELAAMPGEDINFSGSDTVLSTLGEIDLGLGVRVSNAWTVRGGYRVMGVTGIATADDYSRDYSSVAAASALHANSSLLLHGAYVGADFNW